jgi:hypothetical protein
LWPESDPGIADAIVAVSCGHNRYQENVMRGMKPELLVLGLLMLAQGAQAQWVMVARTASRRIQQMTQKPATEQGFDVATVMIEAPSDKVYQTALAMLQKHEDIKINHSDATNQKIEFSKGEQHGTFQATSLAPKVTQFMIGVSLPPGMPSNTYQVVDGVMKVCAEMNVQCTAE